MRHHLVLSALYFVALGCGSEPPLGTDSSATSHDESASSESRESNGAAESRGNADERSDIPAELQDVLEREALAPGYTPVEYPEPPYGFTQDSTVANFEFLGWRDPAAAGHDPTLVETIRFSDFYNPDGTEGIELLMVNASAVWCSVCQAEYLELKQTGIYEQLRERGLEMLGILFEDADANPARYVDLQNWARTFDVRFPFVLDPGFKMGAFFDRSATPMNMIIDARNMQLLISMTGYNAEIYDYIDRELAVRGR